MGARPASCSHRICTHKTKLGRYNPSVRYTCALYRLQSCVHLRQTCVTYYCTDRSFPYVPFVLLRCCTYCCARSSSDEEAAFCTSNINIDNTPETLDKKPGLDFNPTTVSGNHKRGARCLWVTMLCQSYANRSGGTKGCLSLQASASSERLLLRFAQRAQFFFCRDIRYQYIPYKRGFAAAD